MPGGRPTKRTPEIEDAICEAIIEASTIAKACEAVGIGRTTLWRWSLEDEKFWNRVTRAREFSAYAIEDKVLDNCDTLESPTITMSQSQALGNANRDRLKVAAIRNPRTHGDLTKLEHSGAGGQPLQVVIEMPGEAPS